MSQERDPDGGERAGVPADADATVLDALRATRADLAGLAGPPVPPDVAARWDAALAAESARAVTRDPSRPGRRAVRAGPARAVRWLAAAAPLAAVAVAPPALGGRSAPATPPAPAVRPVELVALGRAAVGTLDVGDLADPDRRAACLAAVAPAAAGEPLLGGRRVVLDGRPGVLLVLATGTRGGLRILTVDPACGPAGGTLIAQVAVG
ncbi:MAG TPA: hypothetical protein VF667_12750 [Pseudonocardia sp.]